MLLIRSSIAPLFAIGLSACTGCSDKNGAALDGGVVDASGVHRPDASGDDVDAGPYADAADEATGPIGDTGSPSPFVGQWDPIPGAPSSCSAAVTAANPAASVGPLKWTPCTSKRCDRLVVDWSAQSPDGKSSWWTIDLARPEPVRLINGQAFMIYRRRFPKDYLGNVSALITVVQPLPGGDPVFAIGTPGGLKEMCSGTTSIGDDAVAFNIVPNSDPSTYVFGWASWSSPHAITTQLLHPSDFGITSPTKGGTQNMVNGAGHIFTETKTPDSVAVFDMLSRHVTLPTALPGESPIVVADGALVADYVSPYSVDIVRADGTFSKLITPTAPHQITAHRVDRSNGDAIVWVEGDGDFQALNATVWTAPYAAAASGIQRRKVAALNDANHAGGADMVANAGVLVNVIDVDKALVTRLSDGMGWLIQADAGDTFTQPVWVDDGSVWILTAAHSPGNASGMVRFDRTMLGGPTVAPGF